MNDLVDKLNSITKPTKNQQPSTDPTILGSWVSQDEEETENKNNDLRSFYTGIKNGDTMANDKGQEEKEGKRINNSSFMPCPSSLEASLIPLRDKLPSSMKFYDFKECWFRPYTIDDLNRVTRILGKKDFSLESVAKAISPNFKTDNPDFSVIDLTRPDFDYLCLCIREASFPSKPITFKWTSRYGNKIETKLIPNEIVLKLTGQEKVPDFMEERQHLYTYPTVRNLIEAEDLDDSIHYRLALVCKGKDMLEKMKTLESIGIDAYVDVPEFLAAYQHGVERKAINLKDHNFDPDAWAKSCRQTASILTQQLNLLDNPMEAIEIGQRIVELEEEADKIEKLRKEGSVVQPVTEQRMFRFRPSVLLPYI